MWYDSLYNDVKEEIEDQIDSLKVVSELLGLKFELYETERSFGIKIYENQPNDFMIGYNEYYLNFIFKKKHDGFKNISSINLYFAPNLLSMYEKIVSARKLRMSDGKICKPIKVLIEKLGKD